jgi:hypothetical protein
LHGSRDHNNGSDEWDGSGISAGSSGGFTALTEDDTDFLRIQDTGHPGKYAIPSPTNRKTYFTRIADELAKSVGMHKVTVMIDPDELANAKLPQVSILKL